MKSYSIYLTRIMEHCKLLFMFLIFSFMIETPLRFPYSYIYLSCKKSSIKKIMNTTTPQ